MHSVRQVFFLSALFVVGPSLQHWYNVPDKHTQWGFCCLGLDREKRSPNHSLTPFIFLRGTSQACAFKADVVKAVGSCTVMQNINVLL